jgi:hypothetical protein
MTSHPPEPHGQLDLSYVAVSGEPVHTQVTAGEMADGRPGSLIARSVVLADGTQARQLVVDPAQRQDGYRHLDNEILAGRWLYRLTRSRRYPAQVSRLIGFAADSADPFALLYDYRGETAAEVASHLTQTEQRDFQASLMTGLRWLAEAGIVHCAIGPDTVRWDGEQVEITDFSQATVMGAGQDAPGRRGGPVTDRVDVWAALLLCYYISAGQEYTDPARLADWPAGRDLAAEITAGPENCQSAHAILTGRLGAPDPVPPGMGADRDLAGGVEEFFRVRAKKHPDAPVLAEAPPAGETPSGEPRPPEATPLADDQPGAVADDDGARPKGRRWPRGRR